MSEKELEKQLDHSLKWAREVVLHGGYDEQTRNAVVGTIESARFFVAASESALASAVEEAKKERLMRDNETTRLLAECAGAFTGVLEFYDLPFNAQAGLRHLIDKIGDHLRAAQPSAVEEGK